MLVRQFAQGTLLAILLLPAARCAAAPPKVHILDGTHLDAVRQKVLQAPQEFKSAMSVIRENAESVLDAGPWSVLDKKQIPPSGDKHDYYSVGPYWWPDPSKPDGLPYIRHDGKVNPERYEYDSSGLKTTVSAVQDLAFAWYFTEEDKYAERAARLLQVWFLDPATKMKPHLRYGQAIPGRTEGRGIGIIDTAQLIRLVDAVGLLQASEAWTESDHRRLQAWFKEYVHWLLTSSHGKSETATKNNHAVWYDAQVACFALFADDKELARQVLQQVGPRRIAMQIEPDGRMPLELARTKSFSYTQMNLRGFLDLARLGEQVGVDLWGYESTDGRSIERALDWLEPFVAGRKNWEHQQISSLDPARAKMLFRRASIRLDKPTYQTLGSAVDDPVDCLLWPD